MTNRTEVDASNPKRALTQLSVLFGGTLLFAREVVRHAKAGGAINDDELARIQAHCLLTLKDTQAQGLPIQDEALAITQALHQLEEVLRSIR